MSKKSLSKKKGLKLLNQMSKRALQNGIDFYTDAKLIYDENKSYGHAYGLLVLAEEEFAKGWFLHLCHNMIRDGVWYFSQQEEEAVKISDIISNHKAKQFFLEYLRKATIIWMSYTDFPPIEDISEEDGLQIIEQIIEEIENPSDMDIKKIFNKIERNCKSMQRDRERGFYVDIKKNTNTIIAPDQVKKKECEEQLDKAYVSLMLCKISCDMWGKEKLDKKESAILKKLQKRINEGYYENEKPMVD